MNKSISISLGGLSFFIEEDAYQKLQKYLEDVKASLETGEDDTQEIINDVEARIAELFKEWLGNYRQVIDIKDVDKVIEVMGQPEQYLSELSEEERTEKIHSNSNQDNKEKGNKFYQRQLFRDTEDKIIAGVCSGLAHFFGIETIWARLGTLLLFLLSSWLFDGLASTIVLVYIILWIVVPKAITTSDKLKMRGKPVNFDSIKQYVNKEEITEQVGKVKNNISKASSGVGDFFEIFFKILIKIFAIVIGLVFILLGVAWIITYFVFIITLSIPGINSLEYMNIIFDSSIQLYGMIFLLGIVILIPSFFLIVLGMKIITLKKNFRISFTAVITLFVIWLVAVILGAVVSVSLALVQFTNDVEKVEKYAINTGSDTLTIAMNDYRKSDFIYNKKIGIMSRNINFTKDSIIKKVGKKLEVKQSPDSNFYLEVKSIASGKDEFSAQKNLSSIYYRYKIEGNQLQLNNYFTMPKSKVKYRKQEIELVVYVPQNKYIKTNNVKSISHKGNGVVDFFIDNNTNSNKVFKFVGNSLECLTCIEGSEPYGNKGNEVINISKDGIEIRTGKDSININKQGIKIRSNDTDSF